MFKKFAKIKKKMLKFFKKSIKLKLKLQINKNLN